MKKIFLILLSGLLISGGFSMSRPKEEPAVESITATPVYLGNVPFQKLVLKVAQNDGKGSVYYEIEFEENSEITEKEISSLQGHKIQFFGYFKDDPNDKVFIVQGYKK